MFTDEYDSILLIDEDVPPEVESLLPIKICTLSTTTGEIMDVTTENISYFPIIKQMSAMSNEFHKPDDNADKLQCVKIPFAFDVLCHYQLWCIENYTNLENVPWTIIIKMFEFAIFVENYDFIKFFTMKIIPRVLNEPNAFVVRYLLSYSNCRSYLQCSYDEDDWDFNPFHNHSFENDCLLASIPINILEMMFVTLTIKKQRLLMESTRINCSVGKDLCKLFNSHPKRVSEINPDFDLSDCDEHLNIII